jgi:hypothetical protein
VVPATGFRSLLVLGAVSILLGGGFLGSCSKTGSRSAGACAQARVGGKVTCLRPGERCKPGHERVYRSYGLTCKPGAGGHRLRERTFIAPANP